MACQDFIADITVLFGYIAVPLKCEIFEQGFRQCRHSILLLQYQKETVITVSTIMLALIRVASIVLCRGTSIYLFFQEEGDKVTTALSFCSEKMIKKC